MAAFAKLDSYKAWIGFEEAKRIGQELTHRLSSLGFGICSEVRASDLAPNTLASCDNSIGSSRVDPKQGWPLIGARADETRTSVVTGSRLLEIDQEFTRVALFGGVYNNYLALKRVLEVAAQLSVERVFCLGDMGGFGPHPNRCFPLLQDSGVICMAGNYDLALARGEEDCGCGYSDPRDNHFAQISYDYTFQKTSPGNKRWLGRLPEAIRFRLGPRQVHLCHGSPRRTNEFLWASNSPNHLLEKFLTDYDADVMACTHTGIKWQRALQPERQFINVGVIGRPENDGTTHVWFCLLTCEKGDVSCEFVPLAYGYENLANEMRAEELPSEFIQTVETGWWTTCLEIMPGKERRSGRY